RRKKGTFEYDDETATASEAADQGGLALATVTRYCDNPSIANERNFAYLSPILRASMYSGLARQALIWSILSQIWMTTRFGASPSKAVTVFAPVPATPPIASWRPPAALMIA